MQEIGVSAEMVNLDMKEKKEHKAPSFLEVQTNNTCLVSRNIRLQLVKGLKDICPVAARVLLDHDQMQRKSPEVSPYLGISTHTCRGCSVTAHLYSEQFLTVTAAGCISRQLQFTKTRSLTPPRRSTLSARSRHWR